IEAPTRIGRKKRMPGGGQRQLSNSEVRGSDAIKPPSHPLFLAVSDITTIIAALRRSLTRY
ncbi:MAG: hypothetical protein ACKVHO_22080, partial [Verrucomicrobiia bacterium]